MKKSINGFTIVELLIVIVVVGILATISIVAYTGIQNKARNAQQLSAIDTYEKVLRQYKTINETYPTSPGTIYPNHACLGSSYPAAGVFTKDTCVVMPGITGQVDPVINTALETLINQLPDTSMIEVHVPSINAHVRGIYYRSDGQVATIIYNVNDSQKCSRGVTVNDEDMTMTTCALSIFD